MTDFVSDAKPTAIDLKYRSRVLAQIYTYILSWPDPREQEAEPPGETVGESIIGLLPEWSSGSEHEPQSNIESEERSSK